MSYLANQKVGLCRALTGHAWELAQHILVVTQDDAMVRLHCTRCGAERNDRVSLKTGGVEGRSYRYEESYGLVLGKGEKAPAKSALRREVVGMFKTTAADLKSAPSRRKRAS